MTSLPTFFRSLFSLLILVLFSATVFAGDYEDGMAFYDKQDYKSSFPLIEKAAKSGNAKAQFQYGKMFALGQGTTKDSSKAIQWYRRAAEQGNASAQHNLGVHYHDGEGVKKDLAQAAKWYAAAADQGSTYSKFSLGRMYQVGEGVPKDEKKAFDLFIESANQGFERAQYSVGHAYITGLGVKEDYEKGLSWYRKAAGHGHRQAQENLCAVEFEKKNWDEAFKWCQMADEGESKKGIVPSALGLIYLNGYGSQKADYKQAFKHLTVASERDMSTAQYGLGFMYEYGVSTTVDKAKAMMLYEAAAKGGSELAIKRLKELKEN
ncbi:SEL1-like repeat protein [Oxalobacter vibrioformis]|uniref:SEL1-like repeat protein n=1 Tax=Oxalobacter vibrioformis TaxID=933080 RepID=A0A9E9LX36_9BURK|nr:SEL1-like repeat protein [Oxalobacter vibrioformis]WAW09821.1 SEL1-like repeat protein [Oxalobacter vibrioformis]